MLAMALDSGKILWTRQLLIGDMGNAACLSTDKANCPEPHGPDYDLGAAAISSRCRGQAPADDRTEIRNGLGPRPR